MKILSHIILALSAISWVRAQIPLSGSARLSALEQFVRRSDAQYVVDGKCATPMMFHVNALLPELSPAHRMEIRSLMQRPVTHVNRLSPSGRFRVHYDTSGINQPAMIAGIPRARVPGSWEEYVDSVAAIFDHCWISEIEGMGFDPPPADNGEGGGNEYDVYIQSLGAGTFGSTSWDPADSLESGSRRQRYPTYITIDADYLGERTDGLDGLRVTAAHEFHHAIQVGAYGVWLNIPNSDFFFYELTSVWLEEVLFDIINDYYFDLPVFYQGFKDALNRSLRFSTNTPSGYERSVWALYLEQRFGRDIVRQIWDQMRRTSAIPSMDEVLRQHGSSLPAALGEFGHWNLFTGFRANPALYFKEGQNFPTMRMNASAGFTGSISTISSFAYPFSLQYYQFTVPGDTIFAVITQINYDDAYSGGSDLRGFDLMLSANQAAGATQALSNGLTMGFTTESYSDWRMSYLGASAGVDLRNQFPASPNPLDLNRSTLLVLPVDDAATGTAEVSILAASLDLVFSGTFQIARSAGKSQVIIPINELRKSVSSGVHFVFMKTAYQEYTWKLLVIR